MKSFTSLLKMAVWDRTATSLARPVVFHMCVKSRGVHRADPFSDPPRMANPPARGARGPLP